MKNVELLFKFNGKTYSLNGVHAANNRAKYYEPTDADAAEKEVEFALSDESVLHDWLFSNTNPKDFLGLFTLVAEPEQDGITAQTSWDEMELL